MIPDFLRARSYANAIEALSARIAALEGRLAALDASNKATALAALEERVAAAEARSRRAAVYDIPVSLRGDFYERDDRPRDMQEYWSRHNVTNHREFTSIAESLDYLQYRNMQYPGYIDLLPVSGCDGKTVLDYGCGPGNDLVGFSHWSHPKRLIGADVSVPSLEQAKARLLLHGASAELIHMPYGSYSLPLENESVDYIHCSGVLMLVEDPPKMLREFRRVLRRNGEARIMVYNHDSLWLHLYVAYIVRLERGLYAERTMCESFARTTDGEYCPFVHVWRPAEVGSMAAEAGFAAEFIGAALSLWELHLLPLRFKALLDPRLPGESRDFLLGLVLDEHGYPRHRGAYAGIDACYRLRPSEA